MRVQHPEKRQFEIAPAGQQPFLTDEDGVAEVDAEIGKNLLEQGWLEVKGGKTAKED